MKKIKFRGISLKSNSFVYGYVSENEGEYYINGEKIVNETLSQFIGRYDKDNKEIYEGDIFTNNGKCPKVIRYNEEHTAFCIANIPDLPNEDIYDIWQISLGNWWDKFNDAIKVIGNVFENKELLNIKSDERI